MTTTGKMQNKVALVTGGGGAIGGASARLLASEGAKILVADERSETAEAVAQEVKDAGGAAEAISIDVADPGQCKAAVDAAVSAFGELHVLVNVAAAVTPDAPVDELPFRKFVRRVVVRSLIWRRNWELSGCPTARLIVRPRQPSFI